MELDDLKQAWQQQTPESIDVRNDKKITDMIQNKSYGPLASLKSRYERGFYIVAIAYAIFFIEIFSTPGKWQKMIHGQGNLPLPVLWLLLIIFVSALTNQIWCYFLIRKMQNSQAPVKAEIEHNLNFIDRSIKIQRWVGLGIIIGLCAAIEVVTYRYRNSDTQSWYNVSVYLRYLAYAAYTAFVYFFSKRAQQRQFGKHIDYMKDMLGKME